MNQLNKFSEPVDSTLQGIDIAGICTVIGWKQYEIAAHFGVATSTISRWITGKSTPSKFELLELRRLAATNGGGSPGPGQADGGDNSLRGSTINRRPADLPVRERTVRRTPERKANKSPGQAEGGDIDYGESS